MTTPDNQITTRAEPETLVSRIALPSPRPSCRGDAPGGDGSGIQNPASGIEHLAPSIQPPRRKLTRNGKVARLSYLQRDMVNRMLRNNRSHEKIVDALGEVGVVVTRRNISNWKTRGG